MTDATEPGSPDSTEDAVSKTVVVRKYGLLAPLDWDQDCEDELRRMTQLWNALVEIEQGVRAKVRDLTNSDESAQAAQTAVRALIDQRNGLIKERKTLRSKARAKVATPALDTEIDALSKQVAQAAEQAKLKGRAARASMKDDLNTIEMERRELVKTARQNSGLWWCNYNAVVASYETARKAALKTGAELRFQRHDGSGRFVNQLQGGLSVADMFEGERTQIAVRAIASDAFTNPIRGERRRKQRTTLRATIFTTKVEGKRPVARHITFPMIMHREIPEACRIKEVQVVREKVGPKYRWAAVFTCTREAEEPAEPQGPAVAVNFGWRSMGDGLRVATILREGDQKPWHVTLSKEVIDSFEYCSEIRSERDVKLNEIIAYLKKVDFKDAPEDVADFARRILMAPKVGFGLVARLAILWREHHWNASARERLEEWRKFDKRRWLEESNLRDKLTARRLNDYRNAVLNIVLGASQIVITPFDISRSAKLEGNELVDQARANRVMAAPYEFRQSLVNAAKREGVPVVEVSGGNSFECHSCESQLKPVRPEQLFHTCSNCGSSWDQDHNACINMLAKRPDATGPGAPVPLRRAS